jgi:uncharacterized membrane protein
VLNRWFFAVFFGTAACCLLVAAASFFRWQKLGAAYPLVGGLLYLVGTILVTMMCNVPLNDKLAAVDPASTDAGLTWANYLKTWMAWNHVLTVAALAAAALETAALLLVCSFVSRNSQCHRVYWKAGTNSRRPRGRQSGASVHQDAR